MTCEAMLSAMPLTFARNKENDDKFCPYFYVV